MVKIGIVSRPNISEQGRPNTMVLEDYRRVVLKFDCIPIVILPPQDIIYYKKPLNEISKLTDKEKRIIEEQINLCNGIIMPGGTVMHEYDKYVCEFCNKNDIPLLGTCMGMQIMCNYDNDNQNIKLEDDSHHSNDDYKHEVNINKDSKLYEILNKENIKVNSYHRYKVANSGSYKVSAKCGDVIEAVEKEGRFNIGVQWHPERIIEDENSMKIFQKFIGSCKNN